jgi:TetR/AcrR family transcriptional regulator
METEKLRRRERDKLRQRAEIFAAALDLFSEKGFHNVSMHEIAKKAEFAIGTLYKFFRNKQDLYEALVSEQYNQFYDTLVQALGQPGDEIEKLKIYVRTKEVLTKANLSFIRLYFAESRGVSYTLKTGLNEEIRKGYRDLLESVAAVFQSGIKKGRFKDTAPPYHLALAFDSLVNAFHLHWIQAADQDLKPEDSETILNIFFQGLVKTSCEA